MSNLVDLKDWSLSSRDKFGFILPSTPYLQTSLAPGKKRLANGINFHW